MSDLNTLIDMGFTKERAERALEVTNNRGVEAAMEFLLSHADEEIPSGNNSETLVLKPTPEEGQSADGLVVRSFKCNECNRLFKNEVEMQFHASKSGHSDFSESTEEKKPLTEEEKKEQLAKLEEKLKQKRLERENREKQDELDREKVRIKSGKDLAEARRKMEEVEMQKIVEQRKREKQEEKLARERVKAQIESDKAARRAKLAADMGQTPTVEASTSAPAPSTTQTATKSANYTHAKIQVRVWDGSVLTETFEAKESLAAIRLFIQLKHGDTIPFNIMTSFPRRVFTDEDYDKPLYLLGLVPSAVLIVTKAPGLL
ncbi:UBX domain-containing protein 1 [Pseudolycoriella hygida]|uniref:UBX domain-containing protein 1 n=1 Tax=Pseudolycoriella hygida TaxID=35572 RepID=A0A9Q0N8I2_9DIPT|nr:UBX domain-containing protein 1 [Pseudolycoriella hygida]